MTVPRQALPGGARQSRRILLGLAPLAVFFSLTVGFGILQAILQSLGLAGPSAIADTVMGFSAYRALVSRPDMLAALWHTLYVAFTSSLLATMMGTAMAYWLWRAPPSIRSRAAVFRLPIILPHIVVAFLTAIIWSPTGLFASALRTVGIDFGEPGFPALTYARNGLGMVLAYAYKGFPFVALLSLGVLDRMPVRLITTAQMLGAGERRTFVRVVLPQLGPILNQSFIILFLYATGGFDIPWLLGASLPQMLPMTVYSLYFQGSLEDRAVAMAALSVLALLAFVFVVLYSRIARRLSSWERLR